MSYNAKLSSILHRQKVLAEITAGSASPSRTSINNSTGGKSSPARSSSRSPSRINMGKSSKTSTKIEDVMAVYSSRKVKSGPSPPRKIRPSSPLRNSNVLPKRKPKVSKLCPMLGKSDNLKNATTGKKKATEEKLSPMLAIAHKVPPSCLKVSEKHEEPTGYASNYLAQKAATAVATGSSKVLKSALKPQSSFTSESNPIKNEGPLSLSEDSFDLLKLLTRPDAWMEQNDSKNNNVSDARVLQEVEQALRMPSLKGGSESQTSVRPKTTPTASMTRVRSQSKTPSLTSLISRDSSRAKNEIEEEDYMVTVDINNNNVLEAIRSTIVRSFKIFDLATPHSKTEADVKNNNTIGSTSSTWISQEVVEDKEQDVDESSVYTGNDIDEINRIPSELIISSTSNHHNSASPAVSASATHEVVRNPDLIPLEIEEQLERALRLKKISHHNNLQLFNHFSSQGTLKESLSRITRRQMIQQEEKVRGCESTAHQLTYKDSATSSSVLDTRGSFTSNDASTVSSFMAAFSDERKEEDDEKVIEEELHDSGGLDVNANLDNADKDNKQRHGSTSRSRSLSRVVFYEHISDTDTKEKSREEKMEKLKGFVVDVNSGIAISAEAASSTIATRLPEPESTEIKKDLPAGTLGRIETAVTISAASLPTFHCHEPNYDGANEHPRRFPEFQGRSIMCPETFAPLEADSGFPSDTTLTNLIGNLAEMRWSSPFASLTSQKQQGIHRGGGSEVETFNNSDLGMTVKYSEEPSLMGSAYDMLSAGFKYASKIIGDETELEPQQDTVHYSGYKIKVHGKELLLESVHVNRDFQINSINGSYSRSRSIHSFISLQPHTLSREVLGRRNSTCEGWKERRIRVVVRITGPSELQAEPIASAGLEHFVQLADGKWTFVLKEHDTIREQDCGDHGAANGRYKNFVEIGCPTGVYPGMIQYGIMNGLLFVDAP